MSILAAAANGQAITPLDVLIAGALLAMGVTVARLLGVFRAGSVGGPMRLDPRAGAGGVLIVLVIGFVIWFGMQIGYGVIRAVQHRMSGDPTPFGPSILGPADFALLSTAPSIAGLVALIVGDRLARPTLPRELGWSLDELPGGLWRAPLAMLSVMPIMLAAMVFLELLYQTLGYEHPTEHELLTVLGRSRNPVTKALIIGGATLLAPVFEEFLFRGHLQTVLVRAFSPRPRRVSGFAVVQEAQPATVGTSDGPIAESTAPPMEKPPRDASPNAKWAAIAITSVLFAVMHPDWTWPLIFLLSLALGYAYERTGNLWVPVLMHLIFNTFNTAFFLSTRSL